MESLRMLRKYSYFFPMFPTKFLRNEHSFLCAPETSENHSDFFKSQSFVIDKSFFVQVDEASVERVTMLIQLLEETFVGFVKVLQEYRESQK